MFAIASIASLVFAATGPVLMPVKKPLVFVVQTDPIEGTAPDWYQEFKDAESLQLPTELQLLAPDSFFQNDAAAATVSIEIDSVLCSYVLLPGTAPRPMTRTTCAGAGNPDHFIKTNFARVSQVLVPSHVQVVGRLKFKPDWLTPTLQPASSDALPGEFIVAVDRNKAATLTDLQQFAQSAASKVGATVEYVYSNVLWGFSLSGVDSANAAELASIDGVRYAEQAVMMKAASIRGNGDPRAIPWHLDRADQASDFSVYRDGYEKGPTLQPSDLSSIWVFDSFVEQDNSAFAPGQVVRPPGYDVVGNVQECQNGASSHGTQVASIVASSVVGLAPGATVYDIWVARESQSGLNCGDIRPQAVIKALNDFKNSFAAGDVLVMSFSFDQNNVTLTPADAQSLREALLDVLSLGVRIVAAAGNGNTIAASPPCAASDGTNSVICVGALGLPGPRDVVKAESNTGPAVDFYAPGEELDSAIPTFGPASGGIVVGSFGNTSAATPVVAGIALNYSATAFRPLLSAADRVRLANDQLVAQATVSNIPKAMGGLISARIPWTPSRADVTVGSPNWVSVGTRPAAILAPQAPDILRTPTRLWVSDSWELGSPVAIWNTTTAPWTKAIFNTGGLGDCKLARERGSNPIKIHVLCASAWTLSAPSTWTRWIASETGSILQGPIAVPVAVGTIPSTLVNIDASQSGMTSTLAIAFNEAADSGGVVALLDSSGTLVQRLVPSPIIMLGQATVAHPAVLSMALGSGNSAAVIATAKSNETVAFTKAAVAQIFGSQSSTRPLVTAYGCDQYAASIDNGRVVWTGTRFVFFANHFRSTSASSPCTGEHQVRAQDGASGSWRDIPQFQLDDVSYGFDRTDVSNSGSGEFIAVGRRFDVQTRTATPISHLLSLDPRLRIQLGWDGDSAIRNFSQATAIDADSATGRLFVAGCPTPYSLRTVGVFER